ncbi:hypothetical protein GUJ93_ZPchr0004g38479 [Zizania palustris]|uniref:Uncharacterized protein n=1 Tax=Zizania palustris TaxID=103762 RepID=A0A8J5SPM4_ZIZPA|nr:hypothetical protein GUJ93_ZPchr0004g38479 [Zizania palustris]
MMGSRRSRRVSWATGGNLCKVRLFLSEDPPSQAGLRPQDNLQAKGSWLLHVAGLCSDDSLPPGFESLVPANELKIDISQIPLIRWKCPPHILLEQDWQVVAGEESKENDIQNERIIGALEAIYPRPTNIPPNPFVSPDIKDSHCDDSKTLLVPLIDDAPDQLEAPPFDLPNNYHLSDKYDSANMQHISNASITTEQQTQSIGATSSGFAIQPDVMAAASAACTAMIQSNQNGSMVDQDLLIKILSDPSQIERLMKEYGPFGHEQSASSSVVTPIVPVPPTQMTVRAAPAPFSEHMAAIYNTNPTLPPPPPMMNGLPSAIPSAAMNPPPPMMNGLPSAIPSAAMNHPPSSSPAVNLVSAPMRGISYYKTLIHQHGGERQESFERHGVQFGMCSQSSPSQNGGIDAINGVAMPNRDAINGVAMPNRDAINGVATLNRDAKPQQGKSSSRRDRKG